VSDANVITLPQIAKKIPAVMRGMPNRVKGLGMVSLQKAETPAGLTRCLELAVKEAPNSPALLYEDREYSYQELSDEVDRVARYLQSTGTKAGDVVSVFIENRPELLICIAALSKLGAVSALINTSQRGAVLAHSIELVSPTRVVVGCELIEAVLDVKKSLPKGADALLFVADGEGVGTKDKAAPKGWVDLLTAVLKVSTTMPLVSIENVASDPFCYFYTSGTTGMPKAAVMTHGRFMKAYAGVGLASIQLGRKDRAMVTLPFYHATALAIGWGAVLSGKASLVMVRHFSARKYWDQVRRYEVTAICYVGELCRYLLALPETKQDRQHSVRLMFGNGLRPNIWTAFKQRFGIKKVMEFYGSSEGNVGFLNLFNFDCTVGFTTVPYAIVEYDLDQDEPIRQSNGFMRKVKKGQAGLLLGEITDSSPFDGYTDPEKTEKTILRNVFKRGDAWFNTGDLMRDQGFRHAQFVDRLGDTFRWKGENVSTAEVENVLSSAPGILDGVVYGVEIPNTNGRAGMATIRLKDNHKLESEALYQHMSQALPKYAVPVFIREAKELETTGTHKYKKTDLKKEGFDANQVADPIWVCLPGSKCYVPCDAALCDDICDSQYAF
jgi:citronellyl-CoA synthetase